MSLPIQAITDAIASHALSLGYFDSVNQHEPKVAPGKGLTCAVWIDSIRPARSSGLVQTSVVMTFNVRVFTSMLTEPQDSIDVEMVLAVGALMSGFSGDFDLGTLARNIDLLGQETSGMGAQAGYVSQDNRLYRVITIVLPIIVNDAWEQVP